jgi:pimeloyl-ACP methyl ester carboxylesterase
MTAMELPAPKGPQRSGSADSLAYDLWLPLDPPPWPGVVVIHGAGSRRQNHADFARLARASGWAALSYDQRGHGASGGAMSSAAIGDAGAMAELLGSFEGVDPARVCARGSSMGGFVAIHAAAREEAICGAIAICPAGEALLLEGIRRGRLEMAVDESALVPWLERHDLRDAAEAMGTKPLILLHADGDEKVPVELSREIHARAAEPKKLIVVPGGHHRSVQHDPELQGAALRWVGRAL